MSAKFFDGSAATITGGREVEVVRAGRRDARHPLHVASLRPDHRPDRAGRRGAGTGSTCRTARSTSGRAGSRRSRRTRIGRRRATSWRPRTSRRTARRRPSDGSYFTRPTTRWSRSSRTCPMPPSGSESQPGTAYTGNGSSQVAPSSSECVSITAPSLTWSGPVPIRNASRSRPLRQPAQRGRAPPAHGRATEDRPRLEHLERCVRQQGRVGLGHVSLLGARVRVGCRVGARGGEAAAASIFGGP